VLCKEHWPEDGACGGANSLRSGWWPLIHGDSQDARVITSNEVLLGAADWNGISLGVFFGDSPSTDDNGSPHHHEASSACGWVDTAYYQRRRA